MAHSAGAAAGGLDKFFGSVTTLGRPGDSQARTMLLRAAHHVTSIMRKRGWQVGRLEEFYPPNPALQGMNVNHGEKVLVRLRHPRDPARFLDMGFVIGTLLHELTHIVHGPHSAPFYDLLEEITSECEMQGAPPDLTLGPDGSAFWGTGHTLGSGARAVPRSKAGEAALRAAEKRMSNGPRTLGGSTVRGVSAREMAATAAVARRAQDMEWCSTPESGPVGRRVQQWECSMCTLFNENTRTTCEVCLSPRGTMGAGGAAASAGAAAAAASPGTSASPTSTTTTATATTTTAPTSKAGAVLSRPSPPIPSSVAVGTSSTSSSPVPFNTSPAALAALSRMAERQPSPRTLARPPRSSPGSLDTPSISSHPPPRPPPSSSSPSFPTPATAFGGVGAYGVQDGWECSHCTFYNHSAMPMCEACDNPRGGPPTIMFVDD